MNVAEGDRRRLHRRLEEVLGHREADTLMLLLSQASTAQPVHFDSRIEMANLKLELRNEIADLRLELRNKIADLRLELRREIADVSVASIR